jgi:hypothetical protein
MVGATWIEPVTPYHAWESSVLSIKWMMSVLLEIVIAPISLQCLLLCEG